MSDQPTVPDAAQHISAASEERFIASTEEFAAESSKATVYVSMAIQALLVGCVVFWVLDVPRQVFGLSFYTEQLLAVTLGLTLALAFVTESTHKPGRIDLAGELDTAISLVVADGRITRIYAIRNPHKLARLDEEATLSR